MGRLGHRGGCEVVPFFAAVFVVPRARSGYTLLCAPSLAVVFSTGESHQSQLDTGVGRCVDTTGLDAE